jgi:hypothetical protein
VGALPLRRSQNPVERAEDKANILKVLDELDPSSTSSPSPLLFFPEGWDNTGRRGLLLYQRFLFSLDRPILPVSLSARVPFELPLNLSILGTNVLKETCWLFFFPYVQFDLHFLPLQYRGRENGSRSGGGNISGKSQTREGGQKVKEREEEEEENDIEFARRVQELTALYLKIVATNYSYREALKLRNFVMSSGGSLPDDETYLLPLPETTSAATAEKKTQ